jgi:hypothetical protein
VVEKKELIRSRYLCTKCRSRSHGLTHYLVTKDENGWVNAVCQSCLDAEESEEQKPETPSRSVKRRRRVAQNDDQN